MFSWQVPYDLHQYPIFRKCIFFVLRIIWGKYALLDNNGTHNCEELIVYAELISNIIHSSIRRDMDFFPVEVHKKGSKKYIACQRGFVRWELILCIDGAGSGYVFIKPARSLNSAFLKLFFFISIFPSTYWNNPRKIRITGVRKNVI